jgi:hypothetical protein
MEPAVDEADILAGMKEAGARLTGEETGDEGFLASCALCSLFSVCDG